jgi:hypothetical protein
MNTSKTSLELSYELQILAQQLKAPTEYFNFPRTFITELEIKSYDRIKSHHGLGHIIALDSLIAPHEICANNPNIRTIKAGRKEVRVYTTPLTQHLIDAALQYQDLLQLIPWKSYICLSWVDNAIKDTITIGTSFIHAILNGDSKDAVKMMRKSKSDLDTVYQHTRTKDSRTIPDFEYALWLTISIIELVAHEHLVLH